MDMHASPEVSDVAAVISTDVAAVDDRAAALRDFLASNYDRLHQRLQRYLGSPDLASDSLHDTWLRLGEMTVPDTILSPGAYIYRVACNLAMDRLRHNRLWQSVGDADAEIEQLADPTPGPEAIAAGRSDLGALLRVMNDLPKRRRDIFLAVKVQGLPQRELAAQYGISLRMVERELQLAQGYCVAHRE